MSEIFFQLKRRDEMSEYWYHQTNSAWLSLYCSGSKEAMPHLETAEAYAPSQRKGFIKRWQLQNGLYVDRAFFRGTAAMYSEIEKLKAEELMPKYLNGHCEAMNRILAAIEVVLNGDGMLK